ncbi:MAG: CaiB/BaiF CoA-transferase family protein [Pseudomonadota bacterium]
MSGPLTDITVIEFTGLGPAPLAGQLLADLGADVITIDRTSAEPDPTDVNRRGKRSVALNLKSPMGHAAVHRLLDRADVIIEGFRPGVMESLRLGPDDVPDRIVYGRLTGWGQDGPMAQAAGHDLTYLAITGALNQCGRPGQPPHPTLNYVADFGGGSMFLVMGILAALIERQSSGKGQVVDAAMVDGVVAMSGLLYMLIARGMAGEHRGQNPLDGTAPFYRTYECADAQYIAVGCIEPHFFSEFLALAGLPADDAKAQNDPSRWAEMHARYEAHFKTRTRDAWADIFGTSDACVAPVLSISEAAEHPHAAARGMFQAVDGMRHPTPAPRFGRSDLRAPAAPGAIGADSESVLAEAGVSAEEIARLRDEGVLS